MADDDTADNSQNFFLFGGAQPIPTQIPADMQPGWKEKIGQPSTTPVGPQGLLRAFGYTEPPTSDISQGAQKYGPKGNISSHTDSKGEENFDVYFDTELDAATQAQAAKQGYDPK